MYHLAKLTAPDGSESFICHEWPGKTSDPVRAQAFITKQIALQAGRAVVFGDPSAFWPSELRAADATRREHKGWKFSAVPASDFPDHPLAAGTV